MLPPEEGVPWSRDPDHFVSVTNFLEKVIEEVVERNCLQRSLEKLDCLNHLQLGFRSAWDWNDQFCKLLRVELGWKMKKVLLVLLDFSMSFSTFYCIKVYWRPSLRHSISFILSWSSWSSLWNERLTLTWRHMHKHYKSKNNITFYEDWRFDFVLC